MKFRYVLVLVSALVLAGCGGSDGPTNPGGAGGLTATQTSLIATAATGAFNVKTLAEEAVQNVAGAVEVASEAAGGTQLTLTGTLTESGPGTGQFTWAAGPNDKMIVKFNGGPTFTITIAAFTGFLGGTAKDFLESHSDFRFHVTAPNLLDLQVTSQAGGSSTTIYVRHVTGTIVSNGKTIGVDLTNNGSDFGSVDGSFVELESSETLTGTLTSGDGTIQIHETDSSHSIFNGSSGTHVVNFFLNGASEAHLGNDVFAFQQVLVKREFTNDRISEPDFWVAQGQLLKNGTVIGQVDWSKAPTEGTTSANQPRAVVKLTAGGQIDL